MEWREGFEWLHGEGGLERLKSWIHNPDLGWRHGKRRETVGWIGSDRRSIHTTTSLTLESQTGETTYQSQFSRKRGAELRCILCPLCNRVDETESHLFWQCSVVKEVAAWMIDWCPELPLCKNSVEDALDSLKSIGVTRKVKGKRLGCILIAFFWCIWFYRNQVVFKGKVDICIMIVEKTKMQAFIWLKCRERNLTKLSWDTWKSCPSLM